MAEQRRYTDEEVERIFDDAAMDTGEASLGTGAAAAPDEADDDSSEGMTLAEIQEIGREAGMSPEAIAAAAARLGSRAVVVAAPRRSHFGMPIAVGRAVSLPRAPSDREWEMLVMELRGTFSAQGKERSSGNLRSWWNSNLRADVAPAEGGGYQLRLQTLKGSARMGNVMGAVALAAAAVALLIPGAPLVGGIGPTVLAVWGAALLGWNAIHLPRWAREREDQFEFIANRARALIKE